MSACMMGLVLLASCHGNHDKDAHADDGHAPEKAGGEKGHDGEIIITVEKAKSSGVAVETVRPGEFHGVIPVSGSIVAASGDEATVVAGMAGVVSLSRPVTDGMRVGRGQALFGIKADRLQDGDPVERARVAYETAKREYDRAARLVKDKIVSEKEFSAIRETYETARIAYTAVAGSKSGGGMTVTSPRGGYVKTVLVKDGDYVTVGQPLMTVTGNRRLYLRADLPGRYYTSLPRVSSAKFKCVYDSRVYDVKALNGRLTAYGKSADNTSSYIPVTFEFDNRIDIMPGAAVEVFLITDAKPGVITLPVAAVTEEQGLNFVYLRTGAEVYEKREVTLGGSDGERVEILSGVKSGDNAVVSGAVQVRLAAAGNAIPAHTHSH